MSSSTPSTFVPSLAAGTRDPSAFAARRKAFRPLHERGCFVIPNPWDVGSARYLQHLGFPALATTSAGFAFSQGLPDGADDVVVSRDRSLAHIASITAAVDLPVTADFMSGHGLETDSVKTLMSQDLSGVPGREVSMITVDYASGASTPAHTHHAQALVYVLEGSIVTQAKGKEPVTLAPGQTWYEGPADVHLVNRNASDSAPAKYLVFMLKGKGAPILTPVK